ncbi:T9SS type A sorting domain-containing protein [Rhodocytophaga rosea]|uniref:T9SS type A sorting domain-containing protein n=1 Tax=Rhodocytophaga rosea TaxID=2704465 RepID=A0A6C0GPQ6_9BACT|nr:T9SS type A sorting domain-containing protein [Rhodocytophaga rosea]QHT69600.1 T9SS type A sorting domain-containing protein [Rhodocytophaga rosea]
MKKILQLFCLLTLCLVFNQNVFSQTLTVTAPANGATGVSLLPTLTVLSTSTGNSASSVEQIRIQIATNANFTTGVQTSYNFGKSTNSAISYSWTPAQLLPNTIYYVRGLSSKYGNSAAISFTTGAFLTVTAPANGATGVSLLPTLTVLSTSTGNSASSVEQIRIQIATNANFTTGVQTSYNFGKSTNSAISYSWTPTTLLANTIYYVRGLSSKYGNSAAISFTTGAFLTVTAPANGATGVSLLPTLTVLSTSTGNSASSVEQIRIQIATNANFTTGVQTSYNFGKSTNSAISYSWTPAQLLPNTIYYVRGLSSKYGNSAAISFTTGAFLTVTAPANGATGVSLLPTLTVLSTSTGNSASSVERIRIQIATNANFTTGVQTSYNFGKSTNSAISYSWTPAQLLPNTIYYVRGLSSKYGNSAAISFRTEGLSYLSLVDGVDATTNNQYANKYITPLTASLVSFANVYDWQFDEDGDFITTPPAYSTTTTGNILNLQADVSGLRSGVSYYVRIRPRRTGSSPIVGSWSGDDLSSNFIYRFYNALHPLALFSIDDPDVTATLNTTKGSMKLVSRHVENATDVVFQIDDDPNFASPFALPFLRNGVLRYWLNTTHPGVSGNVFKANSSYYSIGGKNNPVGTLTHRLVEFLYGYASGTYYVRVRAANANQLGYWSTVIPVTVTLPPRTNVLTNIANNATQVGTLLYFPTVSDDPNYVETSFDLQISRDNFATLDYDTTNIPHRAILPTGIFVSKDKPKIINLLFNTTYRVRVRSYINNSYPNDPAAWRYITFTTQTAPIVNFTQFPASPWTSRSLTIYATTQPGINQYNWEIEKTNAPISTSSKTSTVNYTNFYTYLKAGGEYRIRVRGNATAQGLTGVWSNWVTFSVSASAARIASADDIQGAETDLFSQPVLSPNPFSERTNLNVQSGKNNVFIRITDMRGRVLEELHSTSNEVIELGHRWQKGMYIIQVIDVESNKLIKTIKAVKQ